MEQQTTPQMDQGKGTLTLKTQVLNPTLYRSRNGLSEDARSEIIGMLGGVLASSIDLWTHSKQAHWNLKGMQFIGLHKLFDKISEGQQEYIDLVAERITQLGGVAEGTISAVSQKTNLPEYALNLSAAQDHVEALANSLGTYSNALRTCIPRIEDLQDPGTVDMLTEVLRGVDEWLWFVEAHVQDKSSAQEMQTSQGQVEGGAQEPRAIPGQRAGASVGSVGFAAGASQDAQPRAAKGSEAGKDFRSA